MHSYSFCWWGRSYSKCEDLSIAHLLCGQTSLTQSLLTLTAISATFHSLSHTLPVWLKTQWVIDTVKDHTRQSQVKMSEMAKDFLLPFSFFPHVLVIYTSDTSKIGYFFKYLHEDWQHVGGNVLCFRTNASEQLWSKIGEKNIVATIYSFWM